MLSSISLKIERLFLHFVANFIDSCNLPYLNLSDAISYTNTSQFNNLLLSAKILFLPHFLLCPVPTALLLLSLCIILTNTGGKHQINQFANLAKNVAQQKNWYFARLVHWMAHSNISDKHQNWSKGSIRTVQLN